VPELTPAYLLKVTWIMGRAISEKGITWGIRYNTAGTPQPGHKAKNYPFASFRRDQKYHKLTG